MTKKAISAKKGPRTSKVAIGAALVAEQLSESTAKVHSGKVADAHYVPARFSIMLHSAWVHSKVFNESQIGWQWERERRLYNLVTSLHGKRFMVDGSLTKVLHDRDTGFVETVVTLEFFDLSMKVLPSEFITRDPFSYLAEYGVDLDPWVDPDEATKKMVAEAKDEIKKIAQQAKSKKTAKKQPRKKVPQSKVAAARAKAKTEDKTKAKPKPKPDKKKPKT